MVQVQSEEEVKCRGRDDKREVLFDDEVASLLLDMRERIPKKNKQNLQDPTELCDTRSKKRKFREYSEEECENMEELPEDDDEWMEGRGDYLSELGKAMRKKAPSGSACEKHKRWKKRCPDNCPMRKPKTSRSEPHRAYFEMIQWSLIDLKEYSSEHEEEEEEETVEEETLEEEEFQEKKKRKEERKPKRWMKRGRAGRKYLPQACERHKVLHAKCPANCSDRVKRDAALARQKRLQPPGSSSSSEDLMNDMALP